MHIEFRHLRTVKAIHDCGGLARAAELLNITQSALSHQIKGLEDQAGVEVPCLYRMAVSGLGRLSAKLARY